MPVEIKSLREKADQLLADIESKTNQDTPAVDVAYNRIISNAVAGMSLQDNLHNIDQRKECFPQTASEEIGLPLWAGLVNRPRGSGVQAELQADATGTDDEVIGTGSTGPRWKAGSGINYITKTGATIAGGTASIAILSEQFGTEGTLQIGDTVTLTTTIPGIDNIATISAINVPGAEQESIESWRAAIVQLAAFPPLIGTAAWFANEALAVAGITRVYPYVSQLFPGRVEIFAVDDSQIDGQPSAGQLLEIEAITSTAQKNIMWAFDLLPNAQKRLEAFASPIDIYDVVITEGVPALSASLKQTLEAAIDVYFLTRNPYILGLSPEDQGAVEEVAITAVAQNTIDAQVGETGRFTDIGLTKQGDAPADIYILDPGNRAVANISYT